MQVLTFLRTDRRVTAPGDLSPKPYISFSLPLLCEALQTNGEFITEGGFRKRLDNLQHKSGLPQWFMKPGSDLGFIPTSLSLLKAHGQQRKSVQIYRELFSDEVLAALDKGQLNNNQWCTTSCNICVCIGWLYSHVTVVLLLSIVTGKLVDSESDNDSGAMGEDSNPGTSGYQGEDGATGGHSCNPRTSGDQGEDGATGGHDYNPGTSEDQGEDGATGGHDYNPGTSEDQGEDGATGRHSCNPGTSGDQGEDGAMGGHHYNPGTSGDQGEDGATGVHDYNPGMSVDQGEDCATGGHDYNPGTSGNQGEDCATGEHDYNPETSENQGEDGAMGRHSCNPGTSGDQDEDSATGGHDYNPGTSGDQGEDGATGGHSCNPGTSGDHGEDGTTGGHGCNPGPSGGSLRRPRRTDAKAKRRHYKAPCRRPKTPRATGSRDENPREKRQNQPLGKCLVLDCLNGGRGAKSCNHTVCLCFSIDTGQWSQKTRLQN